MLHLIYYIVKKTYGHHAYSIRAPTAAAAATLHTADVACLKVQLSVAPTRVLSCNLPSTAGSLHLPPPKKIDLRTSNPASNV